MNKNDKEIKFKKLIKDHEQFYDYKQKLVIKILYKFFKDQVLDLMEDFRADGFTDGYAEGYQRAQGNFKQGLIDLYEQGKLDARREIFKEMNAVDPCKIIQADEKSGKVFLDGKELEGNVATILKEEALMFKETKLWDIFRNTISDMSKKVMFESSQSFDDMKTGKAMLFNLDIQESIINILSKYGKKPQTNIPKPIDYGRIADQNGNIV